MSTRRPPQYFWAPLMKDWWTTHEHADLSRDELWVGAVALVLARCSPEPGWLMTSAGPLSVEALAREARLPKRETALCLVSLSKVGTMAKRDADGAVGFVDFERWTRTPEAQRKQAWRAGRRASTQADASPDMSRDLSGTSARTGPTTAHSSQLRREEESDQRSARAREPLQLVAIPEAIPSSKNERRRAAKAASEAMTAKILPIVEAWNRGADDLHKEDAPSRQTRFRDDAIAKQLEIYPSSAEWEGCARALCLDAYWAPRLQLLDLTRKAGGQLLERFMREGKRAATSQASTTWEGRELL